MSKQKKPLMGIANEAQIVEDCEEVAEVAVKYGYDILCDDGVDNLNKNIEPTKEEDPNCDKAKKVLTRYGYDVVCG